MSEAVYFDRHGGGFISTRQKKDGVYIHDLGDGAYMVELFQNFDGGQRAECHTIICPEAKNAEQHVIKDAVADLLQRRARGREEV